MRSIVVTTAPGELPPTLRQDLKLAAFQEISTKRATFLGSGSVDNRSETSPAAMSSGGTLTVEREGPRWRVAPTQPASGGARARQPRCRFATMATARGNWLPISAGASCFASRSGKGAVYILLDEFAWTNAGLDQGDNARALAEILGREIRGGVLAFDEYRHGHGRIESFMTYLSNLPGAAAFIVACRRLGLVLCLRSQRTAQAGRGVCRAGTANGTGVHQRGRPALRACPSRAPGRRGGGPPAPPARRDHRRRVHRPSSRPCCERADLYTKTAERPASPGAAIGLVTELIQFRKRIYGTRTVS